MAYKSRGATINTDNRFHARCSRPVDDGWYLEPEARAPNTERYVDHAKTIISTNQSPDISFSQSINPYKGCEHGCIYCYARPSHEYLDLSAGLDFETKIFYKPNAASLLKSSFEAPSYQCSTIMLGANTDPYQPLERELEISRQILQLCVDFKHPVSIITKSALILRDTDLLSQLAADNLVKVFISLTTLSKELKAKLEPRTAAPSARLRVLKTLHLAGVPTGAMLAPIIPFINDHELEAMVRACALRHVQQVAYIFLRLPHSVADLFRAWLQTHYPDRADRVMHSIQASRGGQDYQACFGTRMRGEGVYAELLEQRFRIACRQYRLNQGNDSDLNTRAFKRCGPQQQVLF